MTNHTSEIPLLYTVDEAAAFARRTPRAMRALRHRGAGPKFRKVGHRILVSAEDLSAWLEGEPSSEKD